MIFAGTFGKLAHKGNAALEQILLLGKKDRAGISGAVRGLSLRSQFVILKQRTPLDEMI